MFIKNKIINNIIKLELKILKTIKPLTPYYSKKLEKNIILSAKKNFSDTLIKLKRI